MCARQQVEQRRKEHEQRNEARRLPAEERKQKKKQKWCLGGKKEASGMVSWPPRMAETEPTTQAREFQKPFFKRQVLVFKLKDLGNKKQGPRLYGHLWLLAVIFAKIEASLQDRHERAVPRALYFCRSRAGNEGERHREGPFCRQFHLTGCCIACPGVANLVVVEGGPRAVKRYKKLMMRRIFGAFHRLLDLLRAS